MNINAVLCLLGITALSALGAGAEDDLPAPCRAWQLPCGNQDYTCTTEESYTLSSLYGPQLGCDDVFNATATPPPGECLLVNGSCRYSTNLLNCTTWLPDCYSEYQCGTFEADNNNESPTLCSNVPPPNSTCIQINGSCQWYNPCRMWRGFCYNPWNCGTTSDYWAFVHGPQPICSLPPPGFVEPIPPGECIVQDGQCSWSNCRSWLNWCQAGWECGTEYQYLQYQALPPPPCPFPGENYQPPIEPGECKFDVAAGSCQYATCPEGKVYQDCGTACPLTCDNYNNPPLACPEVCVEGCFCPTGQVEKGEKCVEPPQCSAVTCPEGKEYSDCGTACPLTCDNYNGPPPDYACSIECAEGCFCPEGLILHGEDCIDPGDCPANPCAVVFCAPGYRCIVSEVTGEAVCDPSCDDSNGGCPANQMCRITEIECLIQLCDNYRLISCQYPLSDSCQPDVDRCPSNSHCLTFNVTQERTCLQSCFLDNGGCGEDRVCVTSPLEEDCTTLARPCSSVGCVDTSDLKDDCPPGFEYTECGAACQTTCDNYQVSPLVCPAVCKPGCVCPQQLARYRDRCVDPLECSTLLRNPPPINPLPQPDGNTVVLIQLLLPGVSSVEFISEQEEVVSAVSVLLQQNGYLDVSVSVYAVVEMDENLQVVLQFTSDEMRPEKLDENEIAALIANGRDTISLDVAEVSVVEVPTFSDDDGLSVGAIAGIVIGALLFSAGAIVIIALIVYCFISQRKVTKIAMTSAAGSVAAKDTHPTSYSKLQEMASLENEYEES